MPSLVQEMLEMQVFEQLLKRIFLDTNNLIDYIDNR